MASGRWWLVSAAMVSASVAMTFVAMVVDGRAGGLGVGGRAGGWMVSTTIVCDDGGFVMVFCNDFLFLCDGLCGNGECSLISFLFFLFFDVWFQQ